MVNASICSTAIFSPVLARREFILLICARTAASPSPDCAAAWPLLDIALTRARAITPATAHCHRFIESPRLMIADDRTTVRRSPDGFGILQRPQCLSIAVYAPAPWR